VISNAILPRRWLMIWFAFWASIIFIPTYRSSLSSPFRPFGHGGSICARRIYPPDNFGGSEETKLICRIIWI